MKRRIQIREIRGTKISGEEIKNKIIELAKKGYSTSQIGEILKNEYNVFNVKRILKKKISQILKESGLYPEIPEDLLFLMKRAIKLREHLKVHKKDKHSTRGLILIESRIKSLAKYYIRKGYLPKDWKYDIEKAKIVLGKYGKI